MSLTEIKEWEHYEFDVDILCFQAMLSEKKLYYTLLQKLYMYN